MGRALVYFLHRESEGNGATGKHFPERKASPWRRQAGGLSVCRSVDRISLKMSGGLSVLSNSWAVSLGITEVCIS